MEAFESIEPSSIYSYTHSIQNIETCPRRKVIKNFCLPDDVRVLRVNNYNQIQNLFMISESTSNSQFNKPVDMMQAPYVFLFTLNKEEKGDKKRPSRHFKSKISVQTL
jgi:hypothetical protein